MSSMRGDGAIFFIPTALAKGGVECVPVLDDRCHARFSGWGGGVGTERPGL